MPPKRKRSPTTYNNVGSSKSSNQRPAKTQSKGKTSVKKTEESDWPAFFQDATVQSVQTFCSSRKHLAITFSIVRKSVENILKRPLELECVAQIKALLPDIVQFAYFSEADIRINADTMEKDGSLDIYAPRNFSGASDGEEYVLVLDFVENGKGRGTQTIHPQGVGYALPVALSPTALKQLIERRNERFCTAVNELIAASAISSEDPVILISNAAHDHIPVDPSSILREAQSSPSSRKAPVIPTPMDRPSIESIIEELKESQEKGFEYRDQIVYERVFEQRDSRWGELSRSLSKNMAKALQATRGVTGFYTHQAAAINSIWDRKNVIVSTSTASGKSIIYQLPTLCALEKDRSVTAIFIYPTKALAQDQKLAIEQLLLQCPGLEDVKVATYDGDTPQDLRNTIRQTASIIFTNFDMLHAAILPYEENWRRFFKSLHLVVVDELHYYTGAFGSHVAMIMRRLRRVCAANGNQDTLFVSCSATIANPRRHMEDVFGVENIEVVTDDGAPAGQKHFLLWNPPNVDPLDPSAGRISSISEAGWLFKTLIKQGIRTIVFCKIRRTCETLMKNVRAELTSEGRLDVLSRVRAYRGGYSQNDRRQIEHEAFSGNLLGIIATNALELGVDIGTLDAVIILGFPSGLASLLQQMGRAGRRARDALSIMVAANKGIDQHYVEHPDELFSKNIEELHVDLDNQVLLESHLQCAAHEMPIHEAHDQLYFGSSLPSLCTSSLKRDNDGWYHTNPKFLPSPSKFISIRGIQEVKYAVIDITHFEKSGGQAKILEEIEFSRAIFELYEGGVFMHQGQTYVIQEVSHDQKLARLVRSDVNWYTRPEEVIPNQTHRIRAVRKSAQRAFYGTVNGVILDMVSLETPPYERMTTGMWMDIPKPIIRLLQAKGIHPETAMYAAQQAMLNHTHLANDMKILNVVPPSAKADPQRKPTRKRAARLIFYDAAGEGSGVCVKGFEQISTLLWSAYKTLEACSCQNGCPSCIRGARHTEENDGSSKVGACLVLRGLLDIAIDPDTVPNFGTLDVPGTVVEADSVRAARGVKVENLE